MTADDDDLDDASLKSMRAVWLSMRDEDPPAAGMSALLAAAAEKAEHLRDESQPWWQRAFAMLRRPPALAFATVLILIGGAVLVTRTSEKTSSEVAAPAPAANEAREAREAREAPMAGSAALPDGDEFAKLHKDAIPPPPPPAPPVVEKPKHGTKPRPTLPEPDRYQRFEQEAPKGEIEAQQGTGAGDISGTTLDSPGRGKTPVSGMQPPEDVSEAAPQNDPVPPKKAEGSKNAEPAKPVPKKPEPPTKTVPKNAEAQTDASKEPAGTLDQLARQAERAAARGDCAAVKSIVVRMKQQDEAFFKARLGKSAAVSKCL
jgi:hypothetical protein